MLKHHVLAIESDDWGAGLLEQVESLHRLIEVLSGHRDAAARPAVMTLGLILAVADTDRMRAGGAGDYTEARLDDPALAPVLSAIRRGEDAGVLHPQLHGMTHYWPPALMASAGRPEVAAWLSQGGLPATERLPDALQSRWIDGSVLPSCALAENLVERAAADEVRRYKVLFPKAGLVAVPTTFIWNSAAERGWASEGVEVIITPGRRYDRRDCEGRPAGGARRLVNGDVGEAGVNYLVRDVYFEPAKGHRAEQVWSALARKYAMGRPCLVESHRYNYLGESMTASLDELGRLLEGALKGHPSLCFATPLEIARAIKRRDPEWMETGLARIWQVRVARLSAIPRFWKLARLTGLAWALQVSAWCVARRADALSLRVRRDNCSR